MDRRTAIKWMAAAAATMPLLNLRALGELTAAARQGYGMDPDLGRTYHPGDLWPLTFTPAQRAAVVALCDTIIPADEESPSASQVGVADFIDEWISSPYASPAFAQWEDSLCDDRALILKGLGWLDEQSAALFNRPFAALAEGERTAICDNICYLPRADPELRHAAVFFARFRDLVAGGFYTTPEGRKDLKYVGNVPLARFDGPPPEVLRQVGLLP